MRKLIIILIIAVPINFIILGNQPSIITPYSLENVYQNSDTKKAVIDTTTKVLQEADSTSGIVILSDASTGKLLISHTVGDKNIATTLYEPGSIIKPLILAAALEQKKIKPEDTYYDQGWLTIEDKLITNSHTIEKDTLMYKEAVIYSLNTGAVSILKSLGNSNAINHEAKKTWFEYMTNKYKLNTPIISDIYSEGGYIPEPIKRKNVNLNYAHTSFGMGLTTTPLHIVAAYGLLVTGEYKIPHINKDTAEITHTSINTPTNLTIQKILNETFLENNNFHAENNWLLGGKSGTAPTPDDLGRYHEDKDIGTYIGYIKTNNRVFILLTRIDQPNNNKIASRYAAELWLGLLQNKNFAKFLNS